MKGKLEVLKAGVLIGWAWDELAPERVVPVRLTIDGADVGTFPADRLRHDLRSKGIGSGRHCFKVPVDPAWLTDGAHEVRAVALPEEQPLGGPLTITRDELPTRRPTPTPAPETAKPAAASTPANPQPPAATGSPVAVRGKLESLKADDLVGWAWDERTPERVVDVRLTVNGTDVGTFRADRLRLDLRDKGIGSGRHSFKIPVDRDWLEDGDNEIRAVVLPEEQPLGAPLTITRDELSERRPPAPDARPDPPAPRRGDGRPPAGRVAVTSVAKTSAPAGGSAATIPLESLRAVLDVVGEVQDTRRVPERLIEHFFKQRRWKEAALVCSRSTSIVSGSARLQGLHGRALLYDGAVDEAVEVLTALRAFRPDRHSDVFYLGVALGRRGEWDAALEVFEQCIRHDGGTPKYRYEAGRASVQVAYGSYGLRSERREALDRAREHFVATLERDDRDWRYHRELASVELALGHAERAYELAVAGAERAPSTVGALTELVRVCVRTGRIDEALAAARAAVEAAPANDTARFNVRLVERLAAGARPRDAVTTGILPVPATGLRAALEDAPFDWIAFEGALAADELGALVRASGHPWAGAIRRETGGTPLVWRRSVLLALLDIDRVPPGPDQLAGLLRLAAEAAAVAGPLAGATDAPSFGDGTAAPSRGTVLLFSQYGIRKFGGGEHFLQQMAHLYRDLGFEPLVVGTQPEYAGEYGKRDGLRYVYVDRSPAEIVRLAVEERAVVAHVISGLVLDVVASLHGLDVRVVHGVHSWRDMYTPTTPSTGYFPDIDRGGVPRPEFDAVIQEAAAVYANADFTRRQIEQAYGVQTPVLYSLPDDVDETPGLVAEASADRDFVLLANSRAEKGFDLLLDVAALLPHRSFRAISSQSSRASAEAAVRARGLENVAILDRVDDMAALYRGARVVAVPSYRFIETFSRVVIEAQRHGVPVVGSNRGNVPYLLERSGTALPEDAEAWAATIEELFADDETWARRSAAALENSRRYGFGQQRRTLARIVESARSPLLVGVGSGLGNIIHTSPLIGNLARRLGRRIDVVVAGDHADLLFVPHRSEYVGHSFVLGENVLRRRYDAVFLTNSFGSLEPPFASDHVIQSRTWETFGAGHELHEAEFNLAAARELLAVDYDGEDVDRYFVGDLLYADTGARLVGLHAGSKGGIWESKRWPHYAELARRLQRDGIPVASFGTSDEYVEGTINMTGGTVRKMANAMLQCGHFVANDSGVMNVANALGIPLTALFAPTRPETRGPLAPTSRTIALRRDCAPCEVTTPYRQERFLSGTCRCIQDIDVHEVHAQVAASLEAATATVGAAHAPPRGV